MTNVDTVTMIWITFQAIETEYVYQFNILYDSVIKPDIQIDITKFEWHLWFYKY